MPSIKYKKKTYAGASFPVLEMTKAEYDALPEAKKMDGTVYMITDDTGGWEAEDSVYDNTESGLTATNVQDALDEIAGTVSGIDIGLYNFSQTFTGATPNTDYTFNQNCARQGWQPLGIVGVKFDGPYWTHFFTSAMYISNWTNVVVGIRSSTTASFTSNITLTVTVLYRKTTQ